MRLSGSAVIFFDAVGTLIHPQPAVEDTYARVGRRWGSALTPAAIKSRFSDAFQQQERWDRKHGYHTSEEREQDRWQSIVKEVFGDVPDVAPLFDELWNHFASADAWTYYPDVTPCLSW